MRYQSNGTIDTTFGTAGKVRTDFGDHNFDQARSAVLQTDGKLVAAGFAISQNGGTQNFALARYGSNGRLDSSFNNDGIMQIDFGSCCQSAYSVLLQGDGKLITVGYPNTESSDADFLLARLNTNGTLDPTFGIAGKVRTSFGDLNDGANGALLQPDGKIVVVGFHPTATNRFSEFSAARYLNSLGPFSLISAVSRQTHGSAGSFDISLPLTSEPGVEDRSTNGSYSLVFGFNSNVISGSASVTSGTGTVLGNPTFSGSMMTVNLSGVTDVQKITVTLTNVTSSDSQVLPATPVSMNVLTGDTNADKKVNNSDVSTTRDQVGMPVTALNFREDFDANGSINKADVNLAKAAVGHTLP